MLSIERLQKIKDFLLEYKQVDVSTLSAMLSVSEPTIRKDLEKLESDGLIQRVHGGATLKEEENNLFVCPEEIDDVFLLEKRSIAEIAEKIICEGEVVFLGHGTICTNIARLIKNTKNLTIITNNTQILYEIGGMPNINLILTGGKVQKNGGELYMTGNLSENIFDNVLISKAFFTVDGISEKHGYTMNDAEEKAFYTRVFKASNVSIVVAEYAKFDKTSLIPFLPINSIPTVITNENVNPVYKEIYFDNGVQLFTTISSINIDDFALRNKNLSSNK